MPLSRRALPLTAVLALLLAVLRPAQALDPDKAYHHYVRDNWSIEQGLPQISVHAITQDREGYLWVGTQAGLARFDGVRFTPFNPENTPALPGILVNSLLADRQGRIWAATYKGVAVYEQGKFRHVPVAGAAPGVPIEALQVAQTEAGDILVASPVGLFRVEGATLAPHRELPGPAQSLLARPGELLVGGRGELYRVAGDAVDRQPLPEDARSAVVTHLAAAQGQLWAGTSAGLFRQVEGAWQRYDGDPDLARSPIEEIFEDSDGNLWVGMVEHLVRLRAGQVHERIVQDPSGIAIRSAFEDREGNLWFGGQWDGLTRLWNGWTRRYSVHEGLDDPTLWSLARDPDGGLWAGTNDGLSRLDDGVFRQVLPGSALPHPNAYTLLAEPGTLWIGTRRGAAVYRDGALAFPPELAPLATAQVNGIVRDHRGKLWFATSLGLFRLDDDGLKRFGQAEGLRDPRARLVYQTRGGRLLLGTQAGLYEIDGDRLQPLGLDQGLRPDLDVTAIHELPGGQLVIGSLSEEVFLFDGQRWVVFAEGQGMPVNSPFFITNDELGYLWVAGIRGIHRAPLDDLFAVAEGRATRVRGEMLLNERGDRGGGQKGFCCNGAGNGKGFIEDGVLWLPTRDGVVTMRTDGIVKNTVAPQARVERVRVLDQWRVADPTADWTLPASARDLAFEFTVPSFQDPISVDLRFRLVGYDRDWHELEDPTRRSAAYTNLPPGDYRFEVVGSNNTEVWGATPAHIEFTILPLFHETPLFYGLLALLLASLVYGGYRQQQLGHRRQRVSLEQLVRQRTEALEVANHRLEDASQTDPATGLRNRRYLANQLPSDLAYYDREHLRRGRTDESMVFALVGIDRFDAVVSGYGPATRDSVLQQLALVLGRLVRTSDYVTRWSDEEFLLVFRPMPNQNLPMLGERIRTAIAEHRFESARGLPLRLGCSIGFSECPLLRDARGRLGWEQLVVLAGHAQRHARGLGGNGWAVYRRRPGVDLDELLASVQGDPGAALASGRIERLASGPLAAGG